MTILDSLRKEYDKLNPFERAVMDAEALERQDGDGIDALLPPTLWDAFHGMGSKLAFALLAFIAVHESQKSETLYWMAMFGFMEHRKTAGKKSAEPGYDEQLDMWLDRAEDGQRRARAWLMALDALDSETGGACMAYVHVFAGEYVKRLMGRAVEEEIEYNAEFEHLRQMWNALATNSPCMPKITGIP